MSKLKLRSYIISQDEIIKVGNDSDRRTKFPRMANKKGIIVRVFFLKDEPTLNLVSFSTGMVCFNNEGQWDFDPIEERKTVNTLAGMFSSDNVMHMSFNPKLGVQQKTILWDRLRKDFIGYNIKKGLFC